MKALPDAVAEFLRGKRIVVAGVSRDTRQPANAIYRKLTAGGHEAIPVNPRTEAVEGVPCYPDVGAIPGTVDRVVIATHPEAALDVVRQCADRGITHVWFHRSFGQGSVSDAAVRECEARGLHCIAGGCPLMYCEPVDIFHRCARWWLARRGQTPT